MKDIEPYLVFASLLAYLVGAWLAVVNRRAPCTSSHIAAMVGGMTGVLASTVSLLGESRLSLCVFEITTFAEINLRLDPLSSYFLLLISAGACVTSLYAMGYLRSDKKPVAGLSLAFNLFLFSMVLVVLANSVFTFLFAWEMMSLFSFFLVVYDDRKVEVRHAGFLYFAMTHISAAFLLVGFLILYKNGSRFDFDTLRAASASLSVIDRNAVFLLALVAFGTKAGAIPLHVWLPKAHPAAPGHVSALMSGVMLKIAIYGLLRIVCELAGPGPAWWGGLILVLGVVSVVLGVLYALTEHDLKRLLAYSSVENIGIIFIGLGISFLLISMGEGTAAAAALTASLFHVLNHAVFKSLLFLGAGAVQHATHTRDMEVLGGLIHRMPVTAFTFLIGSAAISALPMLNGFVSEWLILQSLLTLSMLSSTPVITIIGGVTAGILALTGGLAAFCFVKAFGIVFLGLPRGNSARDAKEVEKPMLAGMGFLALLCVVIGIIPSTIIRLLTPVTKMITETYSEPSLGLFSPGVSAQVDSYFPLVLVILLGLFGLLAIVMGRIIGGPERTRIAPTWVCGVDIEPAMQYTATAFAKPIRIIFGYLVRPYREIEREHRPGQSYFTKAVHYDAGIHPVYEQYIYRPIVATLMAVAHRIRLLQTGSLRTYLGYILATVVAVLLLTRTGGPL